MALNWCFNEPWPAVANNSILQYPALPKPCFEAFETFKAFNFSHFKF